MRLRLVVVIVRNPIRLGARSRALKPNPVTEFHCLTPVVPPNLSRNLYELCE